MLRMYKLTLAIGKSFPRISKCSFSITRTVCAWNPVRYAQNLDLGRQTFRVHAVQTLLDEEPELTVNEINDIVTGLSYQNDVLLKLKDNALFVGEVKKGVNDILVKIGELRRTDDDTALNEIFEHVKNICLSSLSPLDTSNLVKLSHPRFLLRHFCDKSNIKFTTTSIRNTHVGYTVCVLLNDKPVSTEVNSSKEEGVHLACLSAIKSNFAKQFKETRLEDFDDIPNERDVDIGEVDKQRVVTVTKSADEEFGFTIRGGQQKLIKNKEYIQVTIITPILIYNVKPGSPAESCGLKVGDVLIGVEDHNLTEKVHEQVVMSLKKFSAHEDVEFTVIHSKHELMKYEAEQKILTRDLNKVKDEISHGGSMRGWHEARSKVNPMDYFMEQFVEKKVIYRHKKGGNTNRLWHQYKVKKKSMKKRR